MISAAHAAGKPERRLDPLSIGALVLVVTMLIHGADHQRQGTNLVTRQVFWGGVVLAVFAFGALYMTLSHHPRAALYVTVVGFYTAAGVIASHVLPHWNVFSNSYTNEVSADFLSWAAMLSEVVAALVLGVLGLRELRRQKGQYLTKVHPRG